MRTSEGLLVTWDVVLLRLLECMFSLENGPEVNN
jgi:hypothetical protein